MTQINGSNSAPQGWGLIEANDDDQIYPLLLLQQRLSELEVRFAQHTMGVANFEEQIGDEVNELNNKLADLAVSTNSSLDSAVSDLQFQFEVAVNNLDDRLDRMSTELEQLSDQMDRLDPPGKSRFNPIGSGIRRFMMPLMGMSIITTVLMLLAALVSGSPQQKDKLATDALLAGSVAIAAGVALMATED
ncbi:MAG TPA: hypothetical protein V6C57_19685 [Coleofasciculaceae cyanobacterium]